LIVAGALPLAAQTLTPAEEIELNNFEEKEDAKSRFISGWLETSFTGNFDSPKDNQNFGRLFDDRSNELVVNQAVVNFERAVTKEPKFDWGFKLQLMFGTDARYLHSLGMRQHQFGTGEYQGDIPELFFDLHFPLLTADGFEVRVGKFATLTGYEGVNPNENIFYSHTYIFNFGVPTNHTGALVTLHATKALDLMAGVTRGVNTSIDDNNHALSFHGGFKFTAGEGNVFAGSTHIGPESTDNDTDLRYINDLALTVQISEKLSSTTEFNYIRDEEADADGYGVAQYFTYLINKRLSASIRGEVWRDDKGFYVAQYANSVDAVRSFAGQSTVDPRSIAGNRTTYGALTIGLDIKVTVPEPLTGLRIRPELRVDRSFNDKKAFNDSSDDRMFTAAVDAIMTF
jgi:hypothetical protein